ncbi:MAG: hypothetical protein LC799_04380, partial [Actinobacteria bacterium]|nr:hypothetical protein [Actinomycetota bacterium]
TLAPDPEGHQPWALHASTTVSDDAEPGDYPVSAQCAGGIVETTLTVLAAPIDDADQAEADQADADQVSRVPRGAPETGVSAEDVDAGQHVSVRLLAIGIALGAAAGAGAIAWREVRR